MSLFFLFSFLLSSFLFSSSLVYVRLAYPFLYFFLTLYMHSFIFLSVSFSPLSLYPFTIPIPLPCFISTSLSCLQCGMSKLNLHNNIKRNKKSPSFIPRRKEIGCFYSNLEFFFKEIKSWGLLLDEVALIKNYKWQFP